MVIFLNAADSGQARNRGRSARHPRCGPRLRHSRRSQLRRVRRAIHTQDRRNRGRARKADVPRPAQDRSTGSAEILRQGGDRIARLGLCAHETRSAMAGPTGSQTSPGVRVLARRGSARSCAGGAAPYAASRFLARHADACASSGFSARHAGADFAYACSRFLARRSDACASANRRGADARARCRARDANADRAGPYASSCPCARHRGARSRGRCRGARSSGRGGGDHIRVRRAGVPARVRSREHQAADWSLGFFRGRLRQTLPTTR